MAGKRGRPATSGSFKKGQSGNLAGYAGVDVDWKEWCRQFTKANRDPIAEKALEDNRLLMFIIEQAHGKAAQVVDAKLDVRIGLRNLSDEELAAKLKAGLRLLAQAGNADSDGD
jgi:hypothetical protein